MPQAPKRTYVPNDINLDEWELIEPLFQQLLERPLDSLETTQQWVDDYSELSKVLWEESAKRRIDQSCHTEDKDIEKRFLHWVENIAPKTAPLDDQLQRKLLAGEFTDQLDPQRFAVMLKQWRTDVELFREENIPLYVECTKLTKDYDQIVGSIMIDFRGEQRTIQQMAVFQEETDRDTRQEAWQLVADARLEHRDACDAIFDKLLAKRQEIAHNAGHDNYRSYAWQSKYRFDYSPEDCIAFGDAIEQRIMPLVKQVQERRQQSLGLESLRPWDIAVDELGRAPLRPFTDDDIDGFVAKTTEIFRRIDPGLADDFATMQMGRNLDLQTRKGKRAGGYQSSLVESGEPFIFMNAAGLQRDVETLLHEGGHAFHFMWALQEPVVFLQHAPIEFCEVASMSMELLGDDHLGVFYEDDAHAARAKRAHIEGTLTLLPWIASIDGFQNWLYTHPGHTVAQRTETWLALLERFGGSVDYTGLEPHREAMWQRQLHLYHYPFYYVEYGIAQLGALQLWMNYRNNPAQALQQYRDGLSLGGTRPLPDLFAAAGLTFDFTLDTIAPLADAVEAELATLPV